MMSVSISLPIPTPGSPVAGVPLGSYDRRALGANTLCFAKKPNRSIGFGKGSAGHTRLATQLACIFFAHPSIPFAFDYGTGLSLSERC